ncbi:MAG: CvpA family protein [Christensenellales bacterium]|jgi:uncharacterized membrane protein required for colicin V production
MNVVDIIILLILGYGLLAGMYKGFIASGLSLLGFVAAWFGAYFSYSTLMNAALSNSTIMGFCTNLLEAENFFTGTDATALVSEMAGAEAFAPIAERIASEIPLIGNAFANNVNAQAFAGKLFGSVQLTTLAQYLDQTVWAAVFGVLSFIIMFALIYIVVTLFVNLLNHVVSFPMLRKVDWLIGGAFGLLRGAVVAMILYVMADYVFTMFISPDSGIANVLEQSKLLSLAQGISFLDVEGILSKIIGG